MKFNQKQNKVFGTSAAVRGPQDHTARHCGVTVPEPFALSTGQDKKDGYNNTTREEKECTFKPRTIEARHREMVRKILSNDQDDSTIGIQPMWAWDYVEVPINVSNLVTTDYDFD